MDKEMAGFCLQLLQNEKDKMIILLFTGNEALIEKAGKVFYLKDGATETKEKYKF
jgi:hypothetical protein